MACRYWLCATRGDGRKVPLRRCVRENTDKHEHALEHGAFCGNASWLPQQLEQHQDRVKALLASRPRDGREVELRENRGGWRFAGLSGTCECLSEDGDQLVLSVEHDPEDYWPVGAVLLVDLDHETQPFFLGQGTN